MSKQELKPCPFCGGKASLIISDDTLRTYAMICCTRCDVRTPRIVEDVEYCAVDEVKEIWEKRVGE